MKFLLPMIFMAMAVFSCGPRTGDAAQQFPNAIPLALYNHPGLERVDELIRLPLGDLLNRDAGFNANAFIVMNGDTELPSQLIDSDSDGRPDAIHFVCDVPASDTLHIAVRYAAGETTRKTYPQRAHAELSVKQGGKFEGEKYIGGRFVPLNFVRVPAEHRIHDDYFRYEGPGWESDRIAYRFYLDSRNAIDIFGKKIPEIVLPRVGLDGMDSYHEMADWGMDIFKVGNSLGVGSVGIWESGKVNMVSKTDSVTCRIAADGPLTASVQSDYFGWQVGSSKRDLRSRLSISAGSNMTRHDLQLSSPVAALCTGLAKHENTQRIDLADAVSGPWAALGLYGKQSLSGDNLGLAIIYRKAQRQQLTEDENSHILVLSPESGRLSYYFLAVWEQGAQGIRDRAGFTEYLRRQLQRLNHPLEIIYQR